jgi:hypothetical protein
VRLRQRDNADKKIAIVLFNFPPNLGNAGTAAFLDVFASVHRTMIEMRDAGYDVDVPEDSVALRKAVVEGNASLYGTDGNVAARLSLDEYRERFPWYTEIEEYWGYAPGELLTDGREFYILGADFGGVFVAVQPSFGYERDPMRLLDGQGRLTTSRFCGLLYLARSGLRRRCCTALRHTWRVRVYARKAGRYRYGRLAHALARCAAEPLLLLRQQPVRGQYRQAPQRRDTG